MPAFRSHPRNETSSSTDTWAEACICAAGLYLIAAPTTTQDLPITSSLPCEEKDTRRNDISPESQTRALRPAWRTPQQLRLAASYAPATTQASNGITDTTKPSQPVSFLQPVSTWPRDAVAQERIPGCSLNVKHPTAEGQRRRAVSCGGRCVS